MKIKRSQAKLKYILTVEWNEWKAWMKRLPSEASDCLLVILLILLVIHWSDEALESSKQV